MLLVLWGGGLSQSKNNNSSFVSSKKIILSIATISFLASYANATISGNGCSGNSCTIKDKKTNPVVISGGGTLTIENSGSVITSGANKDGIRIYGGGTSSIANKGTIQNTSAANGIAISGNATITNLDNQGLIKGGRYGVNIIDTISIKNLDNKGMITGANNGISIKSGEISINNKGTINSRGGGNGIFLYSSNTVATNIINSGVISTEGHAGMNVNQNATIKTLDNSGMLKGQYGIAMWGGAKIETLKNNGTIKAIGAMDGLDVAAGVYLRASKISNVENTGFIEGRAGIALVASSVENLTNKGTINSTSSNITNGGIKVNNLYGFSTITNLKNEGVINAKTNGISVEAGNTVKTIENSGTINAGRDGISFFSYAKTCYPYQHWRYHFKKWWSNQRSKTQR